MSMNRRSFCTAAAAGGTLVAIGLPSCGNQVDPPPTLGRELDSSGTTVSIPVNTPALVPVGGAVTVVIQNVIDRPKVILPPSNAILLIHHSNNPPRYVAVRSSCPHAACPLGYSASDQLVECPCHGSRFRAIADLSDPTSCAGQVLHLPAVSDLAAWPVQLVGTDLVIDLANPLPRCTTPADGGGTDGSQTDGGNPDAPAGFPGVVNGTITFTFAQFPQLLNPGGSVVGDPSGLGDSLIVVRVDANTVAVLSDICTHLGCAVRYRNNSMDLFCDCHASAFTLNGAVTGGPAPTPLFKYTAQLTNSAIIVTVP